MKRLHLIGCLLLLVSLQACISNVFDGDDSGKHNKASTDIFMDKDDVQFAVNAANIGLTEIELGKLGIQKGTDKRVKNFGALLIKNHTKIGTRLQLLASKRKITLPLNIDTATQKSIAALNKYSGKAFDNAYLDYIIRDHQSGIKIFEYASKHVVDADLRKIAAKNLLVLNRHLEAISVVRGNMK